MELMILNDKFEQIAIVDEYKSLIWTDRYNSAGDFELLIAANGRFLPFIKEGNYIYLKESEHLMIIETINIETDFDEGDYAKISGRSLESLLDRRIIWNKTDFPEDTTLQNGIKQLLQENVINPSIAKRKINNFIFKETDNSYINGCKFEAQYIGDNLYDAVCNACQLFDVGFKITLNDENKFVFELYYGEDRTYDQTDNPYVIFSSNFENIINSDYLESDKTLKNITLVGGEDVVDEQIKVNKKKYLVGNNPTIRSDGMNLTFKNIETIDTLLNDIIAQKGSYKINGISYSGYSNISEIRLNNYKASTNLLKRNFQQIKLATQTYSVKEFSADETSIQMTLVNVNYPEALYSNCIHHNGIFNLSKKQYKGYTKFDGYVIDGTNATVTFSKPSIVDDKATIVINSKTYTCYKDYNFTDTSLSISFLNITKIETLLSDISTHIKNTNGQFVIKTKDDKFSVKGFKTITGANVTGTTVDISLTRESTHPTRDVSVVLNNRTYQVKDWNDDSDVLDVTLFNVSNIDTLVSDVKAHTSAESNIVINNTTYFGYTEFSNYSVSYTEIEKRDLANEFTNVTMNGKTYKMKREHSASDGSLSLTIINNNNMETIYADALANNGTFRIDGRSYYGYTKLSGVSYDDDNNASISMSKDRPWPFAETITLNGHEYLADAWSANEGSLTITLTRLDNVNTARDDCNAHNGSITIDGNTYTGYTVKGGYSASWNQEGSEEEGYYTVKELSVTFKVPKIPSKEVSIQFRKPIWKNIVFNNYNGPKYTDYYDSEDELTIDILHNSCNATTLRDNIVTHLADNKPIVIDNKSYTGYEFGEMEVSDELVIPHFVKPTYITIKLNNKNYKLSSYTVSDASLGLDFIKVSSIDTLMADAKAHQGDIVIEDETYSGYTLLGEVGVQTELSIQNGGDVYEKFVSIQMNKPEEVKKEAVQRRLAVFNTQQETSNLDRREMYTSARDISSELEDGKTLLEDEYNSKLNLRGLEDLSKNKMTMSLDGQFESSILFSYGDDFFIGDVVQIENEFGITGTARITEFIRSEDPSGYQTYPTFEMIQEE